MKQTKTENKMKNDRHFLINCVGWENKGRTMRGGWIQSASTHEEADAKIQQWSEEICNGDYVNWPKEMRPEWITDMQNRGTKISFTVHYISEHTPHESIDTTNLKI